MKVSRGGWWACERDSARRGWLVAAVVGEIERMRCLRLSAGRGAIERRPLLVGSAVRRWDVARALQ